MCFLAIINDRNWKTNLYLTEDQWGGIYIQLKYGNIFSQQQELFDKNVDLDIIFYSFFIIKSLLSENINYLPNGNSKETFMKINITLKNQYGFFTKHFVFAQILFCVTCWPICSRSSSLCKINTQHVLWKTLCRIVVRCHKIQSQIKWMLVWKRNILLRKDGDFWKVKKYQESRTFRKIYNKKRWTAIQYKSSYMAAHSLFEVWGTRNVVLMKVAKKSCTKYVRKN